LTIWGEPTSPDSTSSRTRRKLWSKRRLKPTWNFTPAFRTASSAAFTLGIVVSIGFSQKMSLPALAAWMMKSEWVSVEEQMTTAWMSLSPKMTCGSLVTVWAPSPLAQASMAGVRLTSATALSLAWGMK